MGRNLILCSDGTGNSGGKTRGTNVWRIYNAVDRHRHPGEVEQLAFYDDGVGTQGVKFLRLLGGAFGLGLSRNVCSIGEVSSASRKAPHMDFGGAHFAPLLDGQSVS